MPVADSAALAGIGRQASRQRYQRQRCQEAERSWHDDRQVRPDDDKAKAPRDQGPERGESRKDPISRQEARRQNLPHRK
jgi:hypothetical protein